MIMNNNYTNPVSMDEIQRISMKKNQEELDKLCKKICLCIGWSSIIIISLYMISIIVTSYKYCYGDECDGLIIIEEHLSGSDN